jgi:DNA (cytosine-5)-methyltransferase 1
MVELGYGIAYRVLDAQHFGVPQRRRRVFVVGYLGDWRRAGAVLFERQGLSGNNPPRREKGEDVALCLGAGSAASGQSPNGVGQGNIVSATVTSKWSKGSGGPAGDECGNLVSESRIFPTIDRMMEAKFGSNQWVDSGQFVLERPIALQGAGKTSQKSQGSGIKEDCSFTLNCMDEHGVAYGSYVRRLTPRECERLQGFPDDYSLVPYRGKLAADGPRYKALGNSMAVPVMRWIGERIAMVDATPRDLAA